MHWEIIDNISVNFDSDFFALCFGRGIFIYEGITLLCRFHHLNQTVGWTHSIIDVQKDLLSEFIESLEKEDILLSFLDNVLCVNVPSVAEVGAKKCVWSRDGYGFADKHGVWFVPRSQFLSSRVWSWVELQIIIVHQTYLCIVECYFMLLLLFLLHLSLRPHSSHIKELLCWVRIIIERTLLFQPFCLMPEILIIILYLSTAFKVNTIWNHRLSLWIDEDVYGWYLVEIWPTEKSNAIMFMQAILMHLTVRCGKTTNTSVLSR